MPPTQTTSPSVPSQSRSSQVTGAEPQWPKLSEQEARAEVERASGGATTLGDLRGALPAARGRRTDKTPAERAPLGGGAGAVAGAGGAAAAVVVSPLTTHQRETVIDQALLMLEELYAHLPLKRALHAIDPIQRLRLLRLNHQALDEREFQSEMIDIFVNLRDLHTNYLLPSGYQSKYAFLPFRVEEYYAGEERKYLVSGVSPLNTDPNLKPGVEITHWSGVPIELAVARNARREAGSNPEARRARGLEALTLRWLGMSLPPEEDWVTLTYTDGTTSRESRIEWRVIEPGDVDMPAGPDASASGVSTKAVGLDVKTEMLRRVRKALFDGSAVRADVEMKKNRREGKAAATAAISVMPDVYPRFGDVTTPSGKFGYVRLATFAPPNADINGAVNEFVRIVRTLSPKGLILDVRGNGGGYVNFGERLLQTMSPRPITPEPFHFVTTAFTLRLAQAESDLGLWAQPLATALATGAGFSQGFPLTDPAECNNIGQVYQGPVLLVTDAFCYSTTDMFAAGFQDHGVGIILGCHDNTGAGGANVWDYDVLQSLGVAPNPFVALPGGVGMRVAARRSTRVGERAGVPLEDLGVVPDERYRMTRADLLEHNVDLIAKAAQLLAARPLQSLSIEAVGAAPVNQVRVTSTNIDRVDIVVDGRPVQSTDITASPTVIALPKSLGTGKLVAQGYRAGALVASVRL